MLIDLTKGLSSKIAIDLVICAENIDLESEFARIKDEVEVHGEVSEKENLTVVEAGVRGKVIMDCSRCLKSVEADSDFRFSTAFVRSERFTEDVEIELDVRDLDISLVEGDELDITKVVREQILLSLPSVFVCEDDCKGLCEVCGANLNLINCNCRQKDIDPRWSALKGLK